MNGYYELVVKLLKQHGFSLLRQTWVTSTILTAVLPHQ
jgi:hypothetical protein